MNSDKYDKYLNVFSVGKRFKQSSEAVLSKHFSLKKSTVLALFLSLQHVNISQFFASSVGQRRIQFNEPMKVVSRVIGVPRPDMSLCSSEQCFDVI